MKYINSFIIIFILFHSYTNGMEQGSFFSEKIVGSVEMPTPYIPTISSILEKYNITDLDEQNFLYTIASGDEKLAKRYLTNTDLIGKSSPYIFDAALELLPTSSSDLKNLLIIYKNTQDWLRNQ